MDFDEIIVLDAADIRITSDGYLVAQPRVARTGVQLYHGWQVGRPEVETVRVYRPEETVFDKKSMQTFAHRPITIGHKDMVNSKNWGDLAVGTTGGDVIRDGEFLRVSMMIADEEAIKLVKDERKELSVGYFADLEWKEGKTASGEVYDAVQSNVRTNHVAVVAQARGGPKLRLGDNEEKIMGTKNFTIDGMELQLGETEGAVVTRSFARLGDELKAANTQVEGLEKRISDQAAEIVTLTKASETKDGEIAVLKQQVKDAQITPEQLDARVAERLAVATKVKAILGDSFSIAGKSDIELQRLCVAKKLGEEAAKAMSDAKLEGAFLAITADAKGGNIQPLVDAFKQPDPGSMTESQTAWVERQQRISDAWKH